MALDKPTHKRLLNRLLLVTTGATLMHALWDGLTTTSLIAAIDLGIAGLFFILYILNNRGFERFTRLSVLISACLILLTYSAVIPRENGASLMFMALLVLPFLLFKHENKVGRWLTVILILLCYLVLEISEYRLFGDLALLEEPDRVSYVVNYLTTALLIYFAFVFVSQAYHDSEQQLMQKERKQQRLAREVQEQNIQLKKANEELDRFVYSVSHDLRAPLRSLLGLMSLMSLEHPPENIKPYIEMMRGRIDHLDAFIQSITEYSRNARLAVQLEEVDLKKLIEEIIDNHRFTDPSDSLKLFYSLKIDSPVRIDKQRVTVILNNLITNAIKYHHPNQPEPYVQIHGKLQDQHLILQVTDNGTGLDPAIRERIFDMFYRGDERSNGSGLGLYVVREMVEKMQGEITVESAPHVGSTFTVRLPMVQVSKQAPLQTLRPDTQQYA